MKGGPVDLGSVPAWSGPPLFDTHCHLDLASESLSVADLIARGAAHGVTRVTTIGAGRGLESTEFAVRTAKAHSGTVFASVGIHPHDAVIGVQSERDVPTISTATFDRLTALGAEPEVVAIGETGLDFYYEHSPRPTQELVFRRQIALARALRKPLIIHTRAAAARTLEILREESARDVGGIMHCFSEDTTFARAALDLGFVASFSGIATFKNAADIREAARTQPADALLIETDAPYLAPVPFRGRANEPALVRYTLAAIAELRGEVVDVLAEQTTANALRIFKIPRSAG